MNFKTRAQLRNTNPSKSSMKVPHNKHLRSTTRRLQQEKEPKRYGLASDQREVFDWYEVKQREDDAGDIYCPKWQSRLANWSQEFADSQDIHDRVRQCQGCPESLELGLFFVAHPIAAFALSNVLQACYELDSCICGKLPQGEHETAEWKTWRPFQYLSSSAVLSIWNQGMASFHSEMKQKTNLFEREAMAERLYVMNKGVRSLYDALSTIVFVFEEKRENMSCSHWMLDLIQKGVDDRCGVIGKHLRP